MFFPKQMLKSVVKCNQTTVGTCLVSVVEKNITPVLVCESDQLNDNYDFRSA